MARTRKPWVADLPEYVPGTAPVAGEEGKLSSNESPVGPPEGVLDAVLCAARRLNRYPDPLASGLRASLARRLGVPAEAVLVGNGSDELIHLIALAYLGLGSRVVVADPPYLMDEISARAMGAEVVRVPLADYRHDLAAMAEVDADLAFVPNPHNPSGTTVSRSGLERFVDASPADLVVVDEAYMDFADDPDGTTALPLTRTGRVAVIRTFSKLYGLAGARIGYVVAAPETVAQLRKVRAPFSVNALAQAAAEAALEDDGHAEKVRLTVRAGREKMSAAFRGAGYYVVPSQANFVLVRAPDEAGLLDTLASAGIVARPGSVLDAPGHVRVSVASEAVVGRLERLLAG